MERPKALLQFANELLAPLREYDRRRGSELVRTLRTYLAHECRPGEAAAVLVVHPHTLAYRLRRIEALLGISVRGPGSLLRVQLPLMVQDVVGDRSETPPTLD